jgi:hypothetical protein
MQSPAIAERNRLRRTSRCNGNILRERAAVRCGEISIARLSRFGLRVDNSKSLVERSELRNALGHFLNHRALLAKPRGWVKQSRASNNNTSWL